MKLRSPSLAILCVVTLLVAWSTHIFGQKKVAAQTETAWGLHTATFDTVHGKVIVNVPDDTAAGDTISGTVIAEPSGKNEAERAKNQDELNGYVVEVEKQKTPVMGKVLKWAVPVALAGGTASVILRDPKGNEVARTNVPVNPTPPPTPSNWSNPPVCQTGRPMSIPGPNSVGAPTEVTIGGKNAPILAQSPRKIVAETPQDVLGKADIEVRKGGQTVHKGETRAIGIQLSATSTTLKRGQQATLTVTVRGLENLPPDEKVPVQLTNKTPAVVRVEGGDVQNFTIARGDPNLDPQTGTWRRTFALTGVRPGGFAILAQVVGVIPHAGFSSLFNALPFYGRPGFLPLPDLFDDSRDPCKELEELKKEYEEKKEKLPRDIQVQYENDIEELEEECNFIKKLKDPDETQKYRDYLNAIIKSVNTLCKLSDDQILNLLDMWKQAIPDKDKYTIDIVKGAWKLASSGNVTESVEEGREGKIANGFLKAGHALQKKNTPLQKAVESGGLAKISPKAGEEWRWVAKLTIFLSMGVILEGENGTQVDTNIRNMIKNCKDTVLCDALKASFIIAIHHRKIAH